MEKDFHIFLIDELFFICHSCHMQIQREIEKRIEKKRQEIVVLKQQLSTAETYLEALLDTAKLLPKDGDKKETVLRAGSDLAKVRDFIKKVGQPSHVNAILEGIGKDINKSNKISLSGSLGSYVRKGVIFTKPAPNTFGLIELESGAETNPQSAYTDLYDSAALRSLEKPLGLTPPELIGKTK
jgi:hypothetical protein